MELTQTQIDTSRKTLNLKTQAFINGQYVDAQSGETFDSISPIDGQVITQVAKCGKQDVELAVKSARSCFERGDWRRMPPVERKRILLKFADLLEKHRLELAIMETLDMGKPIRDSYLIDTVSAYEATRWYAEAIDKLFDQIAPTSEDALAMITHEPIGVVAGITPWNFPLTLGTSKIIQPLATGNSVILKPAEQSPLTSLFIAGLLAEAGVPDGAIAILPGFAEAGQALGLHHDIDCISFTGSTVVGKLLLKYSADSNMKNVHLECGGKSPNVVFADYHDLDLAAKGVARAIFFNQGEVCCAGTRLIIEASIRDQFIDKLQHEAKAWQPGNPLDINTTMGAIVDDTQLNIIESYVQKGQDEGATLAFGGKRQLCETGGYYFEPTLFTNVENKMTIAQEEIFGPVLSVISFKTTEEAMQVANDTHYGLAGMVWTDNINKAHYCAREIRAGSIGVNGGGVSNTLMPFGGYKQSGIDREKSLQGLHSFTEQKSTWIRLDV